MNITKIITWLSGVVIGFVVIAFPAAYFSLSYQQMSGSIETEADINANIITRIISADPRMWTFERVRLREYLTRRPRQGFAEARRIYDLNNAVVAESTDALEAPIVTRTSSLFDSGSTVGRIEISRSLRPLLVKTALIGIAMLPVGFAMFLVLLLLPIRSIRRSEEAIRRERDTAQKYLDVAGVMLLALDRGQRVTLINKEGCRLLGYPEEEILGKPWCDTFVPERLRDEAKGFCARLAGTAGGGENFFFESAVVNARGEERNIAWHASVLTNEAGEFTGVLSSGEDITDRKRLEEQLRQSQKMEAIGQLAGGIAHDFNNILSAVIGYGGLLLLKMEQSDPLRANVDQILAASERAARLVQGLLAFSRKQIMHRRAVDVNEVIRTVQKLLQRLIGEDVALRTELADGAVTVMADTGQLEQVLMNLAMNARDAMPDGGILRIETGYVDAATLGLPAPAGGDNGRFAVISVTDTGTGMDRQLREKIFDPFFTTKEVGKGTGLGLAIVYGIVKQHNGEIVVRSEPGNGSTFSIYLPLIYDAALPSCTEGVDNASLPRGTEQLLLAEDDATVRTTTRTMLENFGYSVLEAADGEEALNIFRRHADDIRLVILDVIMPKKNGKVVYDEMKKLRPGIKALFISGYASDIIQEKGVEEGEINYLPKPAAPAQLLTKVRQVLQQ